MKVLIACEFSGRVREAFRAQGHDAWSCDLLPSEIPGHHFQEDVLGVLRYGWDLLIAHPPCTYLAASGARWWSQRLHEQESALSFTRELLNAPIPQIALENPVGKISTAIRRPDQIVQPWWFGDGEVKATCLWLKGLPKLVADNVVEGRVPRVHYMRPGPERGKLRSITPAGLARAMAEQWG